MENTPKDIEEHFGFTFNLPLRVEVKTGPNWSDMEVMV
jgi:hypothetical protein